MPNRDKVKVYMWLVKTSKSDFFITVYGNWTEEEAIKRVKAVFDVQLKLGIDALIPRKRATGDMDACCTLYQNLERKDGLDIEFLAGKKLWEVCGRGAEYEAQLILLKAQER